MLDRVEQVALSNVVDDLLERDSPILPQTLVFLVIPFEQRHEPSMGTRCTFGNRVIPAIRG